MSQSRGVDAPRSAMAPVQQSTETDGIWPLSNVP